MLGWLALDIGGANIKLADGQGYADSQPFSLWKTPHRLAQELRMFIAQAPPSDHLAVTMTGELADCFPTKSEGVKFIVDAVMEAADSRHTRVYLSNGAMVTPQAAQASPHLAAASNWHALARFVTRFVKREPGLLIDVGSTTCDIIALVDGLPAAVGQSDVDRMAFGELVYTGIERSPICALVDALPYRGRRCPVAQELFATTQDVYLTLGVLPEEPSNLQTADGGPATRLGARTRLARMVCVDRDSFNESDALTASIMIFRAQLNLVAAAVAQVVTRMPKPPVKVIISGHGDMLARRSLEVVVATKDILSLSEKLGKDVGRCASAHALAVLAREATAV